MIGALQVLSGYAVKLPRMKETFHFHPGLNILFGPNGCGKSTTLKIAAAYCGCTSGWSGFHPPHALFGFSFGKKKGIQTLPESFHRLSPGGCKATLEWDGTPTLFSDPGVTDATMWHEFFYDKKDSPDGMTGIDDQASVIWGKPSAGQLRLSKLQNYYKALSNPPIISKLPNVHYNSTWMGAYQKMVDYVNSLSKVGPVTLLLDEPERSLSIENQMLFWKRFIPKVSKDFQVVIATHSVFSLTHEANWIEFEPGYLNKSREAIKELYANPQGSSLAS